MFVCTCTRALDVRQIRADYVNDIANNDDDNDDKRHIFDCCSMINTAAQTRLGARRTQIEERARDSFLCIGREWMTNLVVTRKSRVHHKTRGEAIPGRGRFFCIAV